MSAEQVATVRPNARIAPYIGLAESHPDSIHYVFTNSSGEDMIPDQDGKRLPKGRLSLLKLLRSAPDGGAALDSARAWREKMQSMAGGAPVCSVRNEGEGDAVKWRTALSDRSTFAITVYTPQDAVGSGGGSFGVVITLSGPSRRIDTTRETTISCDEAAARVSSSTTLPRRTAPF
jgi:hypothetical protein